MFIRIAWKNSVLAAPSPKSLKRLSRMPRHSCDDLGVPACDFARMTKGLFDRQE